jgi:8-oxo-dGTP pyrophosphatase MutT (NUDIX family)
MNPPVATVPAATMLMLRDTAEGLEVFMVVRHHQIDFASGALVFPGGKVDPGDSQVRAHCAGIQDQDATAIAMMVGAIRESFEECGVLLARPVGSSELISGQRLSSLQHYREKLHDGRVTLDQFLESEQLVLACDALQVFAHWVTPEMMPKRFDTLFYLAAAPLDHIAVHDGGESVDSVWIRPQDALKRAKSGDYTIIFPTRLNVELLAQSRSVKDAFNQAENRSLVTVIPWTEKREDGTYICIQEAAGYEVSEEKMPASPQK